MNKLKKDRNPSKFRLRGDGERERERDLTGLDWGQPVSVMRFGDWVDTDEAYEVEQPLRHV